VNWRSLGYLRASLASLYRETRGFTWEVVVVDNASGDGAEDVIRHEFPDVIFIQSDQNLGFARANNLGYRHSTGDVLLFLNPDTEIADNVFARMMAHLAADASTGAVGARLLNSDGSLQTSCVQSYPTIWNQLLDSEFLRRRIPASRLWGMQALFTAGDQPAEVEAISGACFMVRRRVFEQVSLFTETYFMYGEDIDLSYKVSRSSWKVRYLPNCHVIHHGGKSSSKQSDHFSALGQRKSVLHFFRRTRGSVYANCYRLTIAAAAVARMLLLLTSVLVAAVRSGTTPSFGALRRWWATFEWAIGV